MNKRELVRALAERAQMSRDAASRAVEGLFDTASGVMTEAVKTAGKVSLPGFGQFERKERPARKARNPRTGAVIHVPPKTTVRFHPGKTLRKKIEAAEVADRQED